MDFLNSQQLAFILDIKREDARAKMCNAWCKANGIEKTGQWKVDVKAEWHKGRGKKVKDDYPLAMPVSLLAEHLNIPTLQLMVDDVVKNYLNRPASKKYILCDLPEKLVLKAKEAGKKPKAAIPPALKSMLPSATQKTIMDEWVKRFKEFRPEYQPAQQH
jgi:hypothetical protein